MRKLIVALAALALVASANASVRFYFTSADAVNNPQTGGLGGADPGNVDQSNDTITGTITDITAPCLDSVEGGVLYLWATVTDDDNENDLFRKVQGVELGLQVTGGSVDWDYAHLFQWSTPRRPTWTRWETASDLNLGLENGISRAVAAAVTANGIVIDEEDGPLYQGSTLTVLLGAASISGGTVGAEVRIGLGDLGFDYKDEAGLPGRTNAVYLGDEAGESVSADPEGADLDWTQVDDDGKEYGFAVTSGYDACIVPEPATLALLGLAALALRRR